MTLRSPEIAGPMGSMALSRVRPHSSTASLRAVRWHEDLGRIGVHLPLFMVHDVGLALVAGPEQVAFAPRCPAPATDLERSLAIYQELLNEAHASEAARRAPQLRLSDDLIVVVLARVLRDVATRITSRPTYQATLPRDGALFERLTSTELLHLWGTTGRQFEIDSLTELVNARLLVLTLTDSLDIDTLRLFGIAGMAEGGALAQVDLLNSLEAPEANDVVNFSLEILPSVLETKRRHASTKSAAFGYSGLGRRGSLDNLVLTELAWDDEEFTRRVVDNEVLYYAREQQHDDDIRDHWLLIDASASMRGDRATFARAMALATGKKLLLEGDGVSYRFFDSRLYEPQVAVGSDLPTAHILGFKGERGRNPARVFEQLLAGIQLTRGEQMPVIHLFTHASLYIPRDLVKALTAVAQVAAVFILPSGGELDLEYTDLLASHWVIDHQTLSKSGERAEAAKNILDALETRSTRESGKAGETQKKSGRSVTVMS